MGLPVMIVSEFMFLVTERLHWNTFVKHFQRMVEEETDTRMIHWFYYSVKSKFKLYAFAT